MGRCATLERRRKGGISLGSRAMGERRARRLAYIEAYLASRKAKPGTEAHTHLEAMESDGMSYDEIVCFRRLAAKALLQAQPSAFASLFGDRDLLFGSRHAKEEAISQEEIERLHAELEASARAEEAAAAAAAHHHRSAEFRFRLTVPSSLHVVIHSERLNLPPTFHAPSTDLPRPPTDLPCAFRRPSTSLPLTFHGLPPTFHEPSTDLPRAFH